MPGRDESRPYRDTSRFRREVSATSLSIGMDDFELAPFHQKGGAVKVNQLFGKELDGLLKDLNERLAA